MPAKQKPKIVIQGYLITSRLVRGCKREVTFLTPPNQSIKTAKVELLSRDLVNHLPVLLRITVEEAKYGKKQTFHKVDKAKQKRKIRRRTADS